MLVDSNGMFISQRNTPKLSQIAIRVNHDQLEVAVPGHESLIIPVDQNSGKTLLAQVWNDVVPGLHVGSAVDEWFTNYLGIETRLVHMDADVVRPLVKTQLPQDKAFEVSFADGYPYLLTNQASLDDLNNRLQTPIPMDRFRSNLVVRGPQAFAEDNWKKIRIGDAEFQVLKPCARCQITTIDQSNGVSSKEPLKTLASYRKSGGKVMFGMNLVATNQATISVNDPLTILE